MAQDGNYGAEVALELVETPNRFLATVQVGITLVGIFAGAVGGQNVFAVFIGYSFCGGNGRLQGQAIGYMKIIRCFNSNRPSSITIDDSLQ